jgi:hypothetical protein
MGDRQEEERSFRKFITELLQAQKYEFLAEQELFSPKTLNDTLARLCDLIAREVQADSCTVNLKLYDPGEFLSSSRPDRKPEKGGPKFLDVDLWDHVDDALEASKIIIDEEARNVFCQEEWKTKASTLRFPYWMYPKGATRLVASNKGGPWAHLVGGQGGPAKPLIVPLDSGITADIFQDNFAQIRDPLSIRASRRYRKLGRYDHLVWTNTGWRKSFKNFYGSPIRLHPSGEVLGVLKVENKRGARHPAHKNSPAGRAALQRLLSLQKMPAIKALEPTDEMTPFETAVLGLESTQQPDCRQVSYCALAYLAQDLKTHVGLLAGGAERSTLTVKNLLFIPYPRPQSGNPGARSSELLECCGERLVQMMPEPEEEERLRRWLGATERDEASYRLVRQFHQNLAECLRGQLSYAEPAQEPYLLKVQVGRRALRVKLFSWRSEGSMLWPFFFKVSVSDWEPTGDVEQDISFVILVPPTPAESTSLHWSWLSRDPNFAPSAGELYSRLGNGTPVGWQQAGEWFTSDDGQSLVLDLLVDRWAARVEALNYCLPVSEFTAEDTRKLCWAALEIGKLVEREISYRANQSGDPIPLTAMEFYRVPISDLCFVDDMRSRRRAAGQVKVHLDHHVQHGLNTLHMSDAVKFTSRLKEHGSYLRRLGERHEGFVRGNLAIWFYLLILAVNEETKEQKAALRSGGTDLANFLNALDAFQKAVERLDLSVVRAEALDKKFFTENHSQILGDARFNSPPFGSRGSRGLDELENDVRRNLVEQGFLAEACENDSKAPDKACEDLIFRRFDAFAIAGASLWCQFKNLEKWGGKFEPFYRFCFRLRDHLATSQRDIKDTPHLRKLMNVFKQWNELLTYLDSNDTKGFLKSLFPVEGSQIQKDQLNGSAANLTILGIYKRLRHLNHTLWHQRGVAHFDWELRRFDLLGLRLNCLYKNQVFAAYEQLWNNGDPFWGMITQRGGAAGGKRLMTSSTFGSRGDFGGFVFGRGFIQRIIIPFIFSRSRIPARWGRVSGSSPAIICAGCRHGLGKRLTTIIKEMPTSIRCWLGHVTTCVGSTAIGTRWLPRLCVPGPLNRSILAAAS